MNEASMMATMNRLVAALDWIGITYMAFMFIAVIWKPQRICSPGSFRLSVFLFALSLIVPSVVSGTWNLWNAVDTSTPTTQFSTSRASGSKMVYVVQATGDLARIMLATSIGFGILSLIEGGGLRRGGDVNIANSQQPNATATDSRVAARPMAAAQPIKTTTIQRPPPPRPPQA
jgi:hypothetical protein